MSWSRMARLLEFAIDLGKLASGLDTPNRVPEKLVYDYELTDIKRAYGHLSDPAPPPAAGGAVASGTATDGTGSSHPATGNPVLAPAASTQPVAPRCDAWRRWARIQHQIKS